ncbi:alpha/beta fold hydrolase [Marinomonas sp. BSi20584]|uniref:alpha/beta fold hydrolase n=1 Tax=Marinomonas sp. BSi20584 TaxID=1594462 RepID=UPI000C1E546D|nr:alpha/beta hydrolase [Marinomonas sp. BSi20584]
MTTLITVPGIMSDSRTWAPVADALKGYVEKVHTADTSKDDTLEAMAARALSDTQGDLIVIAHSMGGRVAMEMGKQVPERIKAMVLSSTGAEGPGTNEKAHRETRIAEANADMKAYARNWAPKVLSSDNAKNEELIASVRAMVEDCSAEVHERQNLALLHRPDATQYIGKFSFPVLLITGAEDHLSTEAVHSAIAAQIPGAKSLVLANSGHLLPFEQPVVVSQTIQEWLKEKAVI